MATLSIVNFNNKLNILQPSLNVNNNDKQQRDIIIMRKKQKILPAPASDKSVIITNNIQKERKTKTQPMAVARRNARERNRVKLVNDGFATLRQHIPAEIAANFENTGRGGSKKLSKVETLRMAVEYIRSLEYLLSDGLDGHENTSFNYPSTDNSYIDYQQSPPMEDDDYSNPSTSPTMQQYEQIPTTHTYQIITPIGYENDENIRPEQTQILLSDNMIGQNFGYIIDASISDDYSEQSMSPINLENTNINKYIHTLDTHCYTGQVMLKEESEDVDQNAIEDIESENQCYTGQIMLKTEAQEDVRQIISAGEEVEAVRHIILENEIDLHRYKRQIMLKNEMESHCFTGQIMCKKEMDDVDEMILKDGMEPNVIAQDPSEMIDVMNWWKQEQQAGLQT